jgi:hypothetical protein
MDAAVSERNGPADLYTRCKPVDGTAESHTGSQLYYREKKL